MALIKEYLIFICSEIAKAKFGHLFYSNSFNIHFSYCSGRMPCVCSFGLMQEPKVQATSGVLELFLLHIFIIEFSYARGVCRGTLNVLYFLCLDTKKVTKKNQGKPERSARFALPTQHISYSIEFLLQRKICFSRL
jgi:hypothetical protein